MILPSTVSFNLRSFDLHLHPFGKMKPRLKLLFARAHKVIFDHPRTLALIKCNRPPVRNRNRQTPVPIMLRDDLVIILRRLPFQHARPRVLEWQSTKDYDKVVAEHYGYRRLPVPITHRRTVTFDKRECSWMIEDDFVGAGEQ